MDERNIITDEQVVKRAREAVRLELKRMKAMDIPVAVYDGKTKKIYQVYSDGTREEVHLEDHCDGMT
ncbi:MAG: hypothetical protein LUC41_02940 [Clostridiales bacterium]|nr:hypothetical protein [Clostridiales bacterium]